MQRDKVSSVSECVYSGLDETGAVRITDNRKHDGGGMGLRLERQCRSQGVDDNGIGAQPDYLLCSGPHAIQVAGGPKNIKAQIVALDPP